MNKGIIYSAIKNRKITLFLVVLVMIFGIYSYYIAPKQETPDLNAPVAMITAMYPGASPEEVEKFVTRKIEDEVAEIKGYGYSNSYSYNSISTVLLRLEYGTDIDKAWEELRQKMEDVQGELPEGALEINVNTNLIDTAGIILAISGENYSFEALADYAEAIKKKLSKVEGISKFEISGNQYKEIEINIDVNRLSNYDFSMSEVVDILMAQNTQIPPGKIGEGKTRLNVNIPGNFKSVNEIKNTIIDVSETNGSVVRLGDVAKVNIKLKEDNSIIKHNKKPAILLTGYFNENKNIVLIGEDIKKELESIKIGLPNDISIDEVLYQPNDVRDSVNDFIMNLLQGMILVIIVVFVGMGGRNAVIVSTVIPISILITFCVMYIFAIEIHQISIVALIVALGMLVDNAIVVSDAIQSRIDNNEEKISACVMGTKEVAIPVFTSTLTTIGALSPLLLLSSIAGEYISSLPIIAIVALFASYMVALLVTPTLAFIFFRQSKKREKPFRIRKFFESLLLKSMERKKSTIGILFLGIILAVFIVSQLGLQFFPKADKNMIYVDIKTEQNIDVKNTEKLSYQVTDILGEESEIISQTLSIGGGLPKFFNTIPVVVNAPDVAQIMLRVDLNNTNRFNSNTELINYLQEKLNKKITDGTAVVKELEIGEPIGSPIRVRVTGEHIEKLAKVSKEIKIALSSIKGATNIDDDYSEKVYEFKVELDSDKLSYYGLSRYNVQKEVGIALRGQLASVYKKYDKDMDIIVTSNINDIDSLLNLTIKSPYTGEKVLLKQVGDVVLSSQIPAINKYNRDYAVMVTSDVKAGFNPVAIQNQLIDKLEGLDLEHVGITFDGEKEKIGENFGSIGGSAVFAVLLIYAILLFQFRSFVQPLVILITIPLSAIGSILGLFILRQPLSFTALFGMVSLMGIVVNNAIVLIDYINAQRINGKSIEAACFEGTSARFRPIMLSSITTIIGLIPLVLSNSELFRPMAISLMAGLLISTLLTLVIIPVVYSILEARFIKNNSDNKLDFIE